MSDKFDAIQRELADSIMHDLPEELAAVVSIVLHEGGDGLVVNYPKSLHGTPDMQLLDGVVRRFGGAFVSRGKGEGSYFLVPRPRRRLPAELANEETVKRAAEQAKIDGDKGGCDLPCKPETISSKIDDNTSPKTVESEKPVATVQPQNSCNTTTTQPQQEQSAASPQVDKVAKVDKVEKVEQVPKQPSPIDQYVASFCCVCTDFGVNCSPKTDSIRRLYCLEILKLRETQTLGVLVAKQCLLLEKLGVLYVDGLKAVNANLEKLTNRPVYRGGGGRSQQARELHVDGGIKWCWNQSHTYEQAWAEDNKDSKEYADLKAKLASAKDAGKKGVFMGDFWVFLDGYGKDAVLRKKTQSDSKGGSR